jgi:hypothetical protein
MGLGEISWEGVNWIHLVQNRDQWRGFLVNTVMNLYCFYDFVNYTTSYFNVDRNVTAPDDPVATYYSLGLGLVLVINQKT